MKKFLTVLLVVAVMFTFSFGSAFALPSEEGRDADYEYAGVADAQKDALKEIKSYVKLSDYTAKGQALINYELEMAKDAIEDAKSIAGVKEAVATFKENVDRLDSELVAKASVIEAGIAASEQLYDYTWMFEQLMEGGYLDIDADEVTNAMATDCRLAFEKAYVIFENAADGYGTVAEVEAALDEAINALNVILEAAMVEGSGVPQAAIDDLVADIEAKADDVADNMGKVDSGEYSSAVFKEYEAALKAGVKAAKAVKSWDEYFDVAAKYLGYEAEAESAADVAGAEQITSVDDIDVDGYEVIIFRKQVSVFDKIAAKTKNMEVVMAAAEKVLDAIGEYDYTKIYADYESRNDEAWTEATDARDALEDAAEGDIVANEVVDEIKNLNAESSKKEIADAVDAAVKVYNKYLRLTGVKFAAIGDEETEGEIDAIAAEYAVDREADEIAALARQYKNLVKAAKSEKAVADIVADFEEAVDAIPTAQEIAAEKAFAKFCKALDKMMAEYIEEQKDIAETNEEEYEEITADQQIKLDRNVAALKELHEEDLAEAPTEDEIVALYADLEYEKVTAEEAISAEFEDLDTPEELEAIYSAKNANLVDNELIDFGAAAAKAKTWKAYFAAVDAAEKAVAKYATAEQEAYIEAVKEANDALKALGAPADTRAYEKAYAEAEEAMGAYFEAKEALDPEVKADKAVLDANKVDEQKWADAQFEDYYFDYLEDEGVEPGTKVVPEFDEIAEDILGLTTCYDDAANEKIAKIISDAYAAIRKAETAAAKDAVAEKAIADLKAVAEKADSEAYDELLETIKEEAAEYFDLYYGAEFASDAAKHIELAQDIIDMQEDFATVAAQIEAVESLKITAGSSAKKGAITVKWTVKGDTSYIDGYQVWKSTKKNSGFKKITKKTTKTQITNKKGLEAGTRYYYKVRAFQVIDGKYYYSDWSNKAYRVAK